MAREFQRRGEDGAEILPPVSRKRRQRGRGRRRDRIENAEQRVRIALLVALDQFREVEVVAGIHANAVRQAAAKRDLLALVEQRDLDPVHFRRIGLEHGETDFHRFPVVVVAPIAGERGIEHLAQPVDDDGFRNLRQDAVVDPEIVLRLPGGRGQSARGHQDYPTAGLLDRAALLLVGRDDVLDREVRVGRDVIGARTRGEHGARRRACLGDAPANEFERGVPVQPHAALGGVHRFGHAEAERPQVTPEGERRFPVDRGVDPRIVVGERVGDDMSGGECDPVERMLRSFGRDARRAHLERQDLAVGGRQIDGRHGSASSGSTSIQRRSSQLCIARSASWTPFAPSKRFQVNGPSS